MLRYYVKHTVWGRGGRNKSQKSEWKIGILCPLIWGWGIIFRNVQGSGVVTKIVYKFDFFIGSAIRFVLFVLRRYPFSIFTVFIFLLLVCDLSLFLCNYTGITYNICTVSHCFACLDLLYLQDLLNQQCISSIVLVSLKDFLIMQVPLPVPPRYRCVPVPYLISLQSPVLFPLLQGKLFICQLSVLSLL